MHKFSTLLLILVICGILFSQSHFLKKTRNGVSYGYYESLTKQELPYVLAEYLKNAKIPYTLYKMPNYVVDFLKYDKGFSHAYRSGKYMIITFTSEKKDLKYSSVDSFYNELDNLMSDNRRFYNYIRRDERKPPHFILDVDKDGYEDLRYYCKCFCLINPAKNTMFVFSKITDSERDALDVLIQQYAMNAK